MAEANIPPDYLGILLVGRTGQGKSTTGNKLLKAAGESVLDDDEIKKFDEGVGQKSCTREIRCVLRQGTKEAKAIQVVDTPGFADSDTSGRLGVYRANLALFRDLIRRRINDNLQIHRVLYFLPHRGPLEVADAVLQEEIEVMHHYFGNAIFDRMVLVATLPKRMQRLGFDERDREESINSFETALKLAQIEGARPKCPPLIFIGFDDSGVDIQRSIESAHIVSNEVLVLDKFVHDTCSRCSVKYLWYKDDDPSDSSKRIGVVIQVKGEGQKCNKEEFISYHSSQCHPLFTPKYSFLEKVVGSAANVATLGIPMVIQKLRNRERVWPMFTSNDEWCANCKGRPGSAGCLDVHTEFKATLPTGKNVVIKVDHTNRFKDYYSKYLDVTVYGYMDERRERERARVLRKFHTRLCYALQGADTTVVAKKLLEKEVISEELCAELKGVPACVDQSTQLMRSLRCIVTSDNEAFEAFLDVLDSSTSLCKNMSRKLKQQLAGFRGDVMAFQHSDSREEPEVTVDPSVQEEYDIMVSSFTTMFSKAMDYIYGKFRLKKVKEHLVLSHPPVRNTMEKCTSTKTVNAVLREQVVTLVNYGHLVELAKRFNVPKALVAVEEFTQERDDFFRSILAKEFAAVAMEKIQKSETTHVTVKFVVSWPKDKATLDKFLLMLQRVFSEIRPFLTLEAVCHSQLEFLCSLPQFKQEEFTKLTRQNEAQLLAEGVVEIFVGDVQLLKEYSQEATPSKPMKTELESVSPKGGWKLAREMDIPAFRELRAQRKAGEDDQIFRSSHDEVQRENRNICKKNEQIMEEGMQEKKKSQFESSQQEQHKPSQKSGVEFPSEKDGHSEHRHDSKHVDKLQHVIEQKDNRIGDSQEQLKPFEAPEGQENLHDKEETNAEDRSAIPLEENFMDEAIEVEDGEKEVVDEEEINNPSLFQVIDSSGGIISWAEEGIIVTVPPGAVPHGRQASISISTDYTTPLSLPRDFELMSPVFHLSSDISLFEKEVDICLFHGADLRDQEDCESMTFLVASAKSSDPLVLQERKGGIFCVLGLTATLQVKHFCRYSIGQKKGQKARRLYALRFLSPLALKRSVAKGVVLAGRFRMLNQDLQHYYERQYREHFTMDDLSPIRLPGDCSKISLDVQSSPGLRTTMSRSKIRKQEMDKVDIDRRMASNPQQYPPAIILTFNQVSGRQTKKGCLQCKVNVKGIEEDVEYSFNLAVASRAENPQEYFLAESPKLDELHYFKGVRVIETVEGRWKNLALSLHLPGQLLRSVEASCHQQTSDCCIRVFQEWMAGTGRKPISWNVLLESLQEMRENVLAQELKQALLSND